MKNDNIVLMAVEIFGAFVLNVVLINTISTSDLAMWFKIIIFIVLGAGDIVAFLMILKQFSK